VGVVVEDVLEEDALEEDGLEEDALAEDALAEFAVAEYEHGGDVLAEGVYTPEGPKIAPAPNSGPSISNVGVRP
jgi:hypothetical protein